MAHSSKPSLTEIKIFKYWNKKSLHSSYVFYEVIKFSPLKEMRHSPKQMVGGAMTGHYGGCKKFQCSSIFLHFDGNYLARCYCAEQNLFAIDTC